MSEATKGRETGSYQICKTILFDEIWLAISHIIGLAVFVTQSWQVSLVIISTELC